MKKKTITYHPPQMEVHRIKTHIHLLQTTTEKAAEGGDSHGRQQHLFDYDDSDDDDGSISDSFNRWVKQSDPWEVLPDGQIDIEYENDENN